MNDITFPTAECTSCEKQVLLEANLDADGGLEHVCFHCGTKVEPALIRWLTEDQVNRSGYITEGWRDPDASRGCRGGACGVQQPDA